MPDRGHRVKGVPRPYETTHVNLQPSTVHCEMTNAILRELIKTLSFALFWSLHYLINTVIIMLSQTFTNSFYIEIVLRCVGTWNELLQVQKYLHPHVSKIPFLTLDSYPMSHSILPVYIYFPLSTYSASLLLSIHVIIIMIVYFCVRIFTLWCKRQTKTI